MGSLIMHIVASKIVKEKYNLSNKFMAGCIMPDVYTKCGIDKNETHFTSSSESDIPNISAFIKKYENKLKDEIVLGYLAHLIEDKIWFKKYINKYVRVIDKNQIKFLVDDTIHTNKEFSDNIYKDYDYIDHYLCSKHNISIDEFKNNTLKYFKDDNKKEKLNEFLYLHEYDKNRKNFFLTENDADEFILLSSNEVESIIKKYINLDDIEMN